MARHAAVIGLLAVAGAWATGPQAPASTEITLKGTDGTTRIFPALVRGAPATVLVFFSDHCPCVRAHDVRLRALAERFAAAGVRFFSVDSEYGATLERDQTEARAREYPFPILLDPGSHLADALSARYATYVAIFDAGGTLRYHGGLDSDQSVLHDDAHAWVTQALDDVLAGRAVAQPETKALGCALQRW